MRLGLIARMDKTGLGYQTKAFYDHLKPHKTMVLDISASNGNVEQHRGWYQDAYFIQGFPTKDQIQRFLMDLDIVFTCETPYNYELYTIAKAMGVKTVNQYNPEFFDYFKYNYPTPDLLIAPSMWLFQEVDNWCKQNKVKHKYIHLPVDRDVFKYRPRTSPRTMHIAGKPAAHDRNGTWEYMHSVPNGIVVTQSEDLAKQIRQRYRMCNVFTGIANPQNMYEFADVLVLPRKYGGNCLPMNEALSCGMPVIMPDISPNNQFLPKEWLVPAQITGSFIPRVKVDLYTCNPQDLKAKIDEIRTWNMLEESEKANEIAERISWRNMKQVYLDAFQEVCDS